MRSESMKYITDQLWEIEKKVQGELEYAKNYDDQLDCYNIMQLIIKVKHSIKTISMEKQAKELKDGYSNNK